GLHDQDAVADAALVLLVVGLEPQRLTHDLAVEGVLDAVLDGDDHRLVHLVADHEALADLAAASRLGRRSLVACLAHSLTHRQSSSFEPGVVRMPSSRSRTTV